MKIFVDSADLNEIKEAFSWGIVDGITTNPSLIKKAISGKEVQMNDYIKEILILANNLPVSLEVNGEIDGKITAEQMVKEAEILYYKFKEFNSSLNIKIPVNPALSNVDDNHFDGLRVIKILKEKGIPVNATLIMTPEQSLLAAKAGAAYVSPFMGRIDDIGGDGNQLIKDTMEVLQGYNFNTEVIGASIRNAEHVRECARNNVEIATIPFKVIKEMVVHQKTFEGVEKFKNDLVPEYAEVLRG